MGPSVRAGLISRLAESGVRLLTGTKCDEITEKGVVVTTGEGTKQTIEADTVVIAAGAIPETGLAASLKGKVPEIHSIGDCVEPRRILEAVGEGYRVGLAV